MNQTVTSAGRHPVEQLAEDFVTRYRRGERPSLTEYVKQFPDVSGELADIIQALLMLEDLGAADEVSSSAPLPEQLGEYRIIREIGRGGMGIVYAAEQSDLGRHVALKVLPAASQLRPTHLERFRRETRAAARLHHTNIIPVYGVGVQNGIHYYAMQYIPGRGLDALLDELRHQRRSPTADTVQGKDTARAGSSSTGTSPHHRDMARIVLQIADALAHAHEHGVLHRDIKPANILLDQGGHPWLGDFGLAYLEGDESLTSTGAFVGTLRYLPPERFDGEGDTRSDIYALGATLYEMLTLRPMFDETDRAHLIHQVTQEEPIAPRRIDRSIPKDLETIVLKSIAKNPADRYSTCSELADDLQRYLADRPLATRRISVWERFRRWVRRNPVIFGLLTAVVGSLVVGLGATWWQWRRAESSLIATSDALSTAENASKEARSQSKRAEQHADRAYHMLQQLLEEINRTPARRSASEIRRRLMEQALKVHEEFLKENVSEPNERINVARLVFEVASINKQLRRTSDAETEFKRLFALVEPEASDANANPEFLFMKASGFGAVASMRLEQLRLDDAEKCCQQSLDLFHELLRRRPSEERYLRFKCLSLFTAGVVAGRRGQSNLAIERFNQAIDVAQPLLEANTGEIVAVKIGLLHVYCNLCIELRRAHRWEESLAAGESGLKLSDDLRAWSTFTLVIEEKTADTLHALGNCLMRQVDEGGVRVPEQIRQRSQQALTYFQRELTIRQNLVDQFRAEPSFRADLAAGLSNCGSVMSRLGQTNDAEQMIDQALSELKEASRLAPTNRSYVKLQVNYLRAMGDNRCRTGNYAGAAELVDAITKLAPGDGFECVGAAQILAQCSAAAGRNANVAADERAKISERFAEQAIDMLNRAVKSGFRDRRLLESSASLRPLRSRAEFQHILSKIANQPAQETPVID